MAQSLEDVFRDIKAQMLACRGTKKAMKQRKSLVQYDTPKVTATAAAAETPSIVDHVVVAPSREGEACRAGTLQVSAGKSTQRSNATSGIAATRAEGAAAVAVATSGRWQNACRRWQEHPGANTKKTHSVSLQVGSFF